MTRYCANCGTEVDETAVFCPTCGQAIDQEVETEIPAAPTWPDPPKAADAAPMARPAPASEEPAAPAPRFEDPTRVEATPPPAPRALPPSAPAAQHEAPRSPSVNVPVTWPVMLSGWLIGAGAAVAAIGVVISLFDGVINPIDLLIVLLLVAVAVTVFFSASIPEVPHLRLVTLAIVLVVFGIATGRGAARPDRARVRARG